MDVTREEFEAYEEVRQSGITNMFDVKTVEAHSGLDRETILAIMECYSIYRKYLHEWKNDTLWQTIEGTGKRATMFAHYEDIVRVYGKPILNREYGKVDVHWIVETDAGLATIYNYKDGKAYLGDEGLDYRDIKSWSIGAKSDDAAQEIIEQIQSFVKERFKTS